MTFITVFDTSDTSGTSDTMDSNYYLEKVNLQKRSSKTAVKIRWIEGASGRSYTHITILLLILFHFVLYCYHVEEPKSWQFILLCAA